MYKSLIKLFPRDQVYKNEPMSAHTTFKIGGPADLLITPVNTNGIRQAVTWCREQQIPFYTIGLGSNLLVLDGGIRGVVIELGKRFKGIEVFGDQLYSMAGTRLSELCKQASYEGMSGLEFAEGIPGSVGGAIAMNAGAYGSDMENVVQSVMALDEEGHEIVYRSDKLLMSYRHSVFSENDHIILGAYFRLTKDEPNAIISRMKDFSRQRREKQPVEQNSAGSIFKRPPGQYVGAMIEELGLKGYRIGGAQISTKHAGFIINTGRAKAQDVVELIQYISDAVYARYDIKLETELRVIGETKQ